MTSPTIRPAEQRVDSFLPTGDQQLLLTAAFCPPETFDEAYAAWAEAVAARGLDQAAVQVIQLLAPRLREAAPTPLIKLIREQYRLTWARTNLTLKKQPQAIAKLQAAGLEVLALKGAALVPLYYKDAGLRSVGDLDVLVRSERVQEAATLLAEDGWRPAMDEREFDPRFAHALNLVNGAGGSIDIHAHVTNLNTGEGADDGFWAKAAPLSIVGIETLTLCPAHQLIHQVIHGAAWNRFPAVRWAADCVMIIRSGQVDWAEVEAETRRLALSPVLVEGLTYLKDGLDQPVPADLIARLARVATPPAVRARLAREIRARNTLSASAALHWWRLHAAADGRTLRMLHLAPDYIRFRISTGATGPWADALRALGLGPRRD